MARRDQSRRAILVVLFLAVAILVVIDLIRPDSFIRSALSGMGSPRQTPLRRLIDGIAP